MGGRSGVGDGPVIEELYVMALDVLIDKIEWGILYPHVSSCIDPIRGQYSYPTHDKQTPITIRYTYRRKDCA